MEPAYSSGFQGCWSILVTSRKLMIGKLGPAMSVPGQKAKYSLRANDVRCGPDNRHTATTAACPKSANMRHVERN